jgi:hypothetical protein
MQAADPGEAADPGCRTGTLLDRPLARRVLAYPEVRSVLIVVIDERVEQPAEVLLVQDDEVVEQFLPNRGDEALSDAVLPATSVAGPCRCDLHRPQSRRHPGRKGSAAVEDHESRRRIERKGLAKLLRAPGSLRGHPPNESADLARQGRAAEALVEPGQPVPVDA